jgi:hypothetical protein
MAKGRGKTIDEKAGKIRRSKKITKRIKNEI